MAYKRDPKNKVMLVKINQRTYRVILVLSGLTVWKLEGNRKQSEVDATRTLQEYQSRYPGIWIERIGY